MEAFIEILNQLDAMTILAMFGIGYFFYTKVTNAFNERINQSEKNLKELVNSLNERINQSEKHLKEYIDAKMEPIQEQVYNHIPTQMKAMEDKFDRKFDTMEEKFDRRFEIMEDKFDRKFDTLYGLIVNKDKDKEVKKEHTKKEKPV